MDELIVFLTSNCCQGEDCLPKTSSCGTVVKRRNTDTNTNTCKEA